MWATLPTKGDNLNLRWIRYDNGNWCDLLALDTNQEHFNNMEGVYIVWHAGQNPATVYVGQGVVRDRIVKHKQENAVLAYQQYGLYVTWASVPATYRDGIERYLAEILNPKIGRRYPDVPPIEVNLPWRENGA